LPVLLAVDGKGLRGPNIFGTTPTVGAGHRSSMHTDAEHAGSWSKNLETEAYADAERRVVEDAIAAVEATRAGVHVNLVTHAAHGHPREYLYDELTSRFGEAVEIEYVEQCGCGGHVSRVTVEEPVGRRE
jgi:putative CGCGG family rSAM target protein